MVELTDCAPTLYELSGQSVPKWVQGRSLLSILTGKANLEHHRDFVRCEYYNALDLPDATYTTMYRDKRYKLVLYHGHQLGELYDLELEPHEFNNLWDSPTHQMRKLDLMQRSFDASMLAMDQGPRRIRPM